MVQVGTFAKIKRLERLSEIPTSPQSPGPGWYDNLDVRTLANPSGGNGPRQISFGRPGMLEEHLKEVKFQERLKTYGWSNELKNRINEIRQTEKESLEILDASDDGNSDGYSSGVNENTNSGDEEQDE